MATLWIRQYNALGRSGSAQLAQEPGTDLSPVTYSTSAQSAAFAAGITYIAITSDAAFHYVIAADPTATVNALRIPANVVHYVGVAAGQKIAAIAAA